MRSAGVPHFATSERDVELWTKQKRKAKLAPYSQKFLAAGACARIEAKWRRVEPQKSYLAVLPAKAWRAKDVASSGATLQQTRVWARLVIQGCSSEILVADARSFAFASRRR